jgi:two-component system, NtrC family, C4-dicarboxylate transport response regulator DctD
MSERAAPQVIFVDDDADVRDANLQSLTLAGLSALAFGTAEEALKAVKDDFAGVMVSDIRMSGMDGLELFRRLSARDPELPVILVSGHSDISIAVAAMQRGAYDFLAKPYSPDHLISRVKQALEKRALVMENRRLATTVARQHVDALVGDSPAIENLRRTIQQIADTDIDILIEGESGTGKGLIASMLHGASARKSRSMVTVDCGALPDTLLESELFGHVNGAFPGAHHARTGRIEYANRSTLFLDAVETLSDSAQKRFQYALETRAVTPLGGNTSRHVDIRVISSSKVDLATQLAAGRFIAPLYYSINGLRLRIPPLRERRGDVPLLFMTLLISAAKKRGREEPKLTPAVWRRLKSHDWPGNVRELQRFADHVVLGLESDGNVGRSADESKSKDLKAQVAEFETALIEDALALANGDVRATIAALNLPRKTFYDKVTRLGINLSRFK